MIFDKNITSFSVTVYGDLSKYNEVISKGRCRIFYKYGNRNGTYITDEFAEKLLQTIPYTPVKGIYKESEDFSDHGESRKLGKIYGIVPKDYNLAWEDFLDEDGEVRTYACVDVLLYTTIYEEANEIIGKSQSMELYDKSIVGKWELIDGKKYFVFQEGCFLGLQVLGDAVEPCFEGAAFYNLYNSFSDFMKEVDNASLFFQKDKQGGKLMEKISFELSDKEKYEAIWSLLNPKYNEENDWLVEYSICEVYDEYVVAKNHPGNVYEKILYTKDNEADSVTLGERTRCYLMYVTEDEKKSLETLKEKNDGTYAKIDEKVNEAYSKMEQYDVEIERLKQDNETFKLKKAELEGLNSTLEAERDSAQANYEASKISLAETKDQLSLCQANYETLEGELSTLKDFKEKVEMTNKQNVLDSYASILPNEILDTYAEKLSEFDEESLDKELAYELKKANPAFYTNQRPGYLPKDEPKGGIEELLMKYTKN